MITRLKRGRAAGSAPNFAHLVPDGAGPRGTQYSRLRRCLSSGPLSHLRSIGTRLDDYFELICSKINPMDFTEIRRIAITARIYTYRDEPLMRMFLSQTARLLSTDLAAGRAEKFAWHGVSATACRKAIKTLERWALPAWKRLFDRGRRERDRLRLASTLHHTHLLAPARREPDRGGVRIQARKAWRTDLPPRLCHRRTPLLTCILDRR
jgi:hypothetical protein